ncbi:hypothetical protein H0E87_031713 [Populus deltoides]|uniref:Uncharacterized protein n=1 Tax=Populus deltoides TaxID=3696 RepID=A0A8T2WD35_POPDE|nr:hypothetical protein H0E87_031713 [Populus deltoides]
MRKARRFLVGNAEPRQLACRASDAGLAPAAPSLPHAGAGQNAGARARRQPLRAREQASRGCRLPRPATPGWPLQRLASRTQGAGQNAGARARRQPWAGAGAAARKPATPGWPLQRLASRAGAASAGARPLRGCRRRASDAGLAPAAPAAARRMAAQAAIVRGSPCFRQPSMAAWAAGPAWRLPLPAAAPVFRRRGRRARAAALRYFLGGADGRRPGGRTEMPLEEQKAAAAGKRVIDAGETPGREAPTLVRV